MTKTIKTKELLAVYNIINTAKYAKMDDADKIKLWKIARQIKPAATKFDEDAKDAAEKMKPYDDFTAKLSKAQEYERVKKEGGDVESIMSEDDYKGFIDDLVKYNEVVSDAVEEFAEADCTVDFEPLSEEAFGKLMASNEWDVKSTTIVGDFVME